MAKVWQYAWLSAPLFALVLAGYALALLPRWRPAWTTRATRIVFDLLLPALLFRLMTGLAALPEVDARLLIAFFGGCFVVFAAARLLGAWYFGFDGVAQSVFALGGVFSNNVLLGVPIARQALGEAAMPAVALVLVFNALTLWTLVTVSVEWARHGALSLAGFGKTAWSVATNPIVAAIVLGAAFGAAGLRLPVLIDSALAGVGGLAGPASLLVLGMGLAQYGVASRWRESAAICAFKLVALPLVVFALARALGLPALETRAVVLLASLAVGANVYLMAAEFDTLQGTIATSLVISTALAAFTTPLVLALLDGLTQ